MMRSLVLVLLAGLAACGGGGGGGGNPTPTPPAVTIPDLSLYLAGGAARSDGQDQIEYSFADPRGFWVTTWSYPTHPADNGGEVYVSDGTTVWIDATQDGGTPGIQRFGTGWGLFDNKVTLCSIGWTPVGALGRACRAMVSYPVIGDVATIISEHWSGLNQTGDMERFYMAADWGRLCWESYGAGPPRGGMAPSCGVGAPDPGMVARDRRLVVTPVDGPPAGSGWPPVGFTP
jgi:hypothetical protein